MGHLLARASDMNDIMATIMMYTDEGATTPPICPNVESSVWIRGAVPAKNYRTAFMIFSNTFIEAWLN